MKYNQEKDSSGSAEQKKNNSLYMRFHQKLLNLIFPDVELTPEIQTILQYMKTSLTVRKNNCTVLMPSRDDMIVDINNGEMLLCIEKDFLSFKHNNVIIKQQLSLDQACYLIDTISKEIQQKYNNIYERISVGFDELMKQ